MSQLPRDASSAATAALHRGASWRYPARVGGSASRNSAPRSGTLTRSARSTSVSERRTTITRGRLKHDVPATGQPMNVEPGETRGATGPKFRHQEAPRIRYLIFHTASSQHPIQQPAGHPQTASEPPRQSKVQEGPNGYWFFRPPGSLAPPRPRSSLDPFLEEAKGTRLRSQRGQPSRFGCSA